MTFKEEVYKALILLRDDALCRGMNDLAIVYGWSLIRISDEVLEEKFNRLFPNG